MQLRARRFHQLLHCGPATASVGRDVTLAVGAILMGSLMLVAVRGLSMAKWLHNSGGLVLLVVLVGIGLFALPHWLHGRAAVAPMAFTSGCVSAESEPSGKPPPVQ